MSCSYIENRVIIITICWSNNIYLIIAAKSNSLKNDVSFEMSPQIEKYLRLITIMILRKLNNPIAKSREWNRFSCFLWFHFLKLFTFREEKYLWFSLLVLSNFQVHVHGRDIFTLLCDSIQINIYQKFTETLVQNTKMSSFLYHGEMVFYQIKWKFAVLLWQK